jgi:PAS domain S-box-containing protein
VRSRDYERVVEEGEKLVAKYPKALEEGPAVTADEHVVRFRRVDLGGDGPRRWLGLVQAVPLNDMTADTVGWGEKILYIKLTLIACGVGLSFLLARRLTRPLQRITVATRELARGQFEVDLPVEARDEIGVLARCFKEMAAQLQQNVRDRREEEARLKAVLRTAAEGIFILDDQGRIEMANQAVEGIFGYRSEELAGENVKLLIPKESRATTGEVGASAIESIRLSRINNRTMEATGRRKDGTLFPLELSVSEVPLGSRRLFTGIVRDVTARKKAEKDIQELNQHLSQLNEQLDRRVQERTRQLQEANQGLALARDQALEASRTKSVFLGQMSHELRTPLNHIKGYADLLSEELEERGLSDLLPDVGKVVAASDRLLAIIGDVLDLTEIETSRLQLRRDPFPLRPLIEEVSTEITPLMRKNGNMLEVKCADESGTMTSDRGRVRQILLNLLTNAARFTTRGRVDLELTREDGWIVLRVRDTGIGLAPETAARIFRPFMQADGSTTRRHDGTGLGLAVTRSICQLMGGDINVESETGKGSVFTVRLPPLE